MFPTGLDAERIERLRAVVAECRAVLEGEGGMDAVQQWLSDAGVSPMDAALVTAELLGGDVRAYRAAKRILLEHPSRAELLERHIELMSTVDWLGRR